MKLDAPKLTFELFDEPSLIFAGERMHVCPKRGITMFGPRSLDMAGRHRDTVHVGLLGTGESVESAMRWLESCAQGVPGTDKEADFPGFMPERGFFSQLRCDDNLVQKITQRDLADIRNIRKKRDRFEFVVSLIGDRLRLLAQNDRPPDYVVLALPRELIQQCGSVEYADKDLGMVHRDLRRAVKAIAMQHRLPTQILLQRTTEATAESSQVDHKSRCAWNFFTGLYYKCGGIPWMASGLPQGTCYVGVSFHKAIGTKRSSYFTGVAQAFDEQGNGLVLRGQDFLWDTNKHGNSAHLPEQLAEELIGVVLKRYRDETKQNPRRVVIHKTSEFWPSERDGIVRALKSVDQFDLISVRPTEDIRILRDARYPILRGSHVGIEREHLLYTTGYISALQAFPHGHVPLPLRLKDHIGDSSVSDVLREMMVLTKMNWNSAGFAGLLPITLRFSRLVGEIMKEIPPTLEPQPQFKFYM